MNRPFIDSWTEADALAATHGEAYYALALDVYRETAGAFARALVGGWPGAILAHSYKTCCLGAVCRAAARQGHLAEVVSADELALAQAHGFQGTAILFNGPAKSDADLAAAVAAGCIVNCDSSAEALRLAPLAAGRIPLGIRVCAASAVGRPSRFGVPIEQVPALASELRRRGCLVAGLHVHSSVDRSPASFASRASLLATVALAAFPDSPPEWLDVGGGFTGPLPSELEATIPGGSPPPQAYATAIAEGLAPVRRRWGDRSPRLFAEPGIALLGGAMQLFARVIDTKQINGRTIAATAASYQLVRPNRGYTPAPLRVLQRPGDHGRVIGAELAGYTCMETDILHERCPEAVAVGDIVCFLSVGGYTLFSKPPFIRLAPAVVAREHPDGGWSPIRRRETPTDLLALEEHEA